MITIKDPTQLWVAACHSPAYPHREAVVVRGEDPRQFTHCTTCELISLLEWEKARRGDEMAGTNAATQLMLDLRKSAVLDLGRQFIEFTDEMDSTEIAIRSPILLALAPMADGGVQEAFLIQLALRCPMAVYSEDQVFEQLRDKSQVPWSSLRLRFPHRMLCAPTFLPGKDCPAVIDFRTQSCN